MILADRRWKAQAADRLVRAILADIGLEVAEAKSGIVHVRDGFEFLGFSFSGRFLRPRPRALTNFKNRVRSRTRRTAPVSIQKMIDDLNPLLRGWGNYYLVGDVLSLFEDLDKWIRMRLRSKMRKRFKSNGASTITGSRTGSSMTSGSSAWITPPESIASRPHRAQSWVSRMREPHVRF